MERVVSGGHNDVAMTEFQIYLDSLIGSWEALAVPQPGARVIHGDGFVASRFPTQPVLDNGVLLDPDALPALCDVYVDVPRWAVWTCAEDTAGAVRAAGFVEDEVTYPMVARLAELPLTGQAGPPVVACEDLTVVAELNQVPVDLLLGVQGLRCYATADHSACALLIEVGSDVNVSFVATRAANRRRGYAGAVLRRALADARADGFTTSSLQATPMARGVYQRLGYRPVSVWQEWSLARSSSQSMEAVN
jgi:GNAT superfamily N-acetyltransferase